MGAWSWVISLWPFNLWEGWGQGRGSRPAEGWRAGQHGACQRETSQEDRWGGPRGRQRGGGTVPCNPPSSLGQQTEGRGAGGRPLLPPPQRSLFDQPLFKVLVLHFVTVNSAHELSLRKNVKCRGGVSSYHPELNNKNCWTCDLPRLLPPPHEKHIDT